MFSTTKLAENSSILSENEQFIHIPQPLPAVAYDYDDGDFDDEIGSNSIDQTSAINLEAQHDVVNNFLHDVTTSRRMGTEFLGTSGGTRRGPTSPYPPPSSVDASKSGPTRKASGGGGGGGGGRHRCPKCGTTVTFRCDFEENTFYCASCSGWFQANPNTIVGNDASRNKADGSPYEEFLAKNGPKKVGEPEILMRHVSLFFIFAADSDFKMNQSQLTFFLFLLDSRKPQRICVWKGSISNDFSG